MSSSHHPWTSLVALVRRTVSALALAAMASSASAAMFTFDGQVDDMAPLGGSRITGSFAYNEPAESGLVEVPLSAFTLTFLGQTYTLTSPNVLAAAWVNNGLFDGFDFLYQDDWASPSVSLHLFSGGLLLGSVCGPVWLHSQPPGCHAGRDVVGRFHGDAIGRSRAQHAGLVVGRRGRGLRGAPLSSVLSLLAVRH